MEVHTANSIQDRTFEFQQAINVFAKQSQKPNVVQNGNDGRSKSTNLPKNEFNRQAGQIAKEIVRVTGALTKLAQLAKRKRLFGDKPTDIVELTYIIKQDIFHIEKELKALKSLQTSSGKGSAGSDAQMSMYNKNVVQLLNTKTKNISENFREVLQERQRSEMLQRSRQEQLLAAVKGTSGGGETGGTESNVPYAVRAASRGDSNNMNVNMSNEGIAGGLVNGQSISATSDNPFLASLTLEQSKEQANAISNANAISSYHGREDSQGMLSLPDQNQQLMLLEEQNNEYIQERSNAVDAIESTINEVGGLFQQLATMVQEQGEVIQRIDDNVEDVSLNISGAQRELMKYYNSVSSNRWLMLKVFGILIVFFLFWVLVS